MHFPNDTHIIKVMEESDNPHVPNHLVFIENK